MAQVSQQGIAEGGAPHCSDCDVEMVLKDE